MVDPNRRINRLTNENISFYNECKTEFANRFTELDDEYVEHCKKIIPGPPIIENWSGKRNLYGLRGSPNYNPNNPQRFNDNPNNQQKNSGRFYDNGSFRRNRKPYDGYQRRNDRFQNRNNSGYNSNYAHTKNFEDSEHKTMSSKPEYGYNSYQQNRNRTNYTDGRNFESSEFKRMVSKPEFGPTGYQLQRNGANYTDTGNYANAQFKTMRMKPEYGYTSHSQQRNRANYADTGNCETSDFKTLPSKPEFGPTNYQQQKISDSHTDNGYYKSAEHKTSLKPEYGFASYQQQRYKASCADADNYENSEFKATKPEFGSTNYQQERISRNSTNHTDNGKCEMSEFKTMNIYPEFPPTDQQQRNCANYTDTGDFESLESNAKSLKNEYRHKPYGRSNVHTDRRKFDYSDDYGEIMYQQQSDRYYGSVTNNRKEEAQSIANNIKRDYGNFVPASKD